MTMDKETEFLNEVLLGREDAVLFCQMLGEISQTWDDLIDKDKPVSDERINEAFCACLLHLPSLPFYADNCFQIIPVLRTAIYDWMAANRMEKDGDEREKSIAFIIRNSLVAVVTQCAFLVGGHRHAMECAQMIRSYFHDETLNDYLTDLEV